MRGRLAASSISAARLMSAADATARATGAGSSSSTSPSSSIVSGGISISTGRGRPLRSCTKASRTAAGISGTWSTRSEEHTSELQSQFHLVCRLLLEKKKKNKFSNFLLNKKKKKKRKK